MNNIETTQNGQNEYQKWFNGKEAEALEQALDIRKFEISLYWKRATYFWTFIGATMAGFLAVQALDAANKKELSVVLSCLGLVFSFAWFLVNRASKFWQENWEKHVDLLENKSVGPLYKVILSKNNSKSTGSILKNIVTGSSKLSVSKINQIISLYVSFVWFVLLLYSLATFLLDKKSNWFHLIIVILSFFAIVAFLTLGKSYHGESCHTATRRKSTVTFENSEQGNGSS